MKIIASLLCVLLPLNAFADELKHIPKWTMVGPKACYEFDKAKKLVELDLQFEQLLQADRLWRQINGNLEESSRQLNLALTAEKHAAGLLKENGEKLTAKLMLETERANMAEVKPGPFPAWAIGAGVGLGVGIIAGIILGVYVAK
jgi:hypothetical protein